MNSKVDNIDVAVPEASPESNEKQEQAPEQAPNKKGHPNRKWIGLGVLFAVIVIIAIAVPLALRKDDENNNNDTNNAVSPGSANATHMSDNDNVHQCFEPKEGDDCTTQESYQQCMDLVNSGCQAIISTFSCPPIHACGDENSPEQAAALAQNEQCPAPTEGDNCITEDSHKECMDLLNSGCQKIYSTFSCPPQHRCGDEAVEQLPAEEDVVMCTMDVKECPDGSSVGRVGPNCEFAPCPPIAACTMELAYCTDGTPVGRTAPYCHFEACPDGGCPTDTFLCDDGTELFRDPALGCEFEACPAVMCTMDVKECPDGSFVGRVAPNCEFEACPEQTPALAACTMELRYCADGTPVGRSGPNCHFETCPDGGCPTDTYHCDNGVELYRDPALGCEFEACPSTGAGLEQCTPPAEGDPCTTEESYKECMDLANNGCQTIYSTFSCPPQHRCGDEPAQLPASAEPLSSSSSQCPAPIEGDDCLTEESHQECLKLEQEGCQLIIATASCPPSYGCADAGEPPAIAACTMELAYCADGTAVGRTAPHCHFEACPDGGCPTDTFLCDDGSELFRDPTLGCEFEACPVTEDAVMCTMDVKECPDGSFVGRVGPNCEFEPCPPPALAACTMELEYCADGTAVGRTGPYCEFEACPDGGCPVGTYTCADGTVLERDPALGCDFPVCEEVPVVACTLDLGICADGSSVGRTAPNCDFAPCPDGGCTIDTKQCPDGSEVSRDVNNSCQFLACPSS